MGAYGSCLGEAVIFVRCALDSLVDWKQIPRKNLSRNLATEGVVESNDQSIVYGYGSIIQR